MSFLKESFTRFILSRIANGYYGNMKKGAEAIYDPNNGMWIAGALSKVQESKRIKDQEAQISFIDNIYDKDLHDIAVEAKSHGVRKQ